MEVPIFFLRYCYGLTILGLMGDNLLNYFWKLYISNLRP